MAGEGFKSWMSLGDESTYGTMASAVKYARVRQDTCKAEENVKVYPGVHGVGRRKVFHGNKSVSGIAEGELHFTGMIGKLLRHVFGGYNFAVNTPVAGANTHTFTMASDVPTGLSVEQARGDVAANQVFQYLGGIVNQATFQFDLEDFLRIIPDIIFQDEKPGQARSGAPSFPSDRPLLWHFLGTATIAGSTAEVKNGSVAVNNNYQSDRYFHGSRLISRPKRAAGGREVTGEILTEFEDLTHYTKYAAGTEGNMALTWTSTEFVTGATPFSLALAATAVHLTGTTPNTSDEGPIEETLAFQALSESAELSAILINADTDYSV